MRSSGGVKGEERVRMSDVYADACKVLEAYSEKRGSLKVQPS